MDSHSICSTEMMKKSKLCVRNQVRFKNTNLITRQRTILKKALELSILCDNQICVLHYDRDGNLVSTSPEDQSQVRDVLDKYRNSNDGEKRKKNTNLSQFYNKKLADEKKRSLTDTEERKRFSKKVGDFKGSLEVKFHLFRDLLSSQDHHQTEPQDQNPNLDVMSQDQSPFLDVMSQENHNFAEASSYGFFPANDFSSSSQFVEEDPLMMNFCPPDLDQQQPFTNLLMSPASSSTVCSMNYNQSKFSVFLFNHETASFTQLPNSSVSSSFDQGLIGTY